MDQVLIENELVVTRQREDRRKTRSFAPPYLTEEGLVLVDRREGRDRRAAAAPAAPKPDLKVVENDLVLERLRMLAEVYGYAPNEIKTGTNG